MRSLQIIYRIGFTVFTLATFPAIAQMYIWKDPETGSTKMSNLQPSWYRSGSGPRTQLMLNGNFIDDTAALTSAEQAASVRALLSDAARQQAEESRDLQLRLTQGRQQAAAEDRRRKIQELSKERAGLIARVSRGVFPVLGKKSDVSGFNDAAHRLKDVNRELNALDATGAGKRADDQKSRLGAAAKVWNDQATKAWAEVAKSTEKPIAKDDLKGAVKEAIKDCAFYKNCY